ncbi:MAG TPA: hypothetical protein VGM29_16275 [Polyangiaceae bacterium]
MRAYAAALSITSCLWLISCGGCPGQPAESPSAPAATEPAAGPAPESPAPTPAPADKPTADKPSEEPAAAKPKKDSGPEPAFTDNMSVEDAIKAAQGTERMNIDQEELSKPLTDSSLYEPCKPGTAHFKLKVAVWRGKAVGIDLTTTPKIPKLTECLKERIRGVTWSAKVPSLNTVSFTY